MERLIQDREPAAWDEPDEFEAEKLYLRDLRKLSTMTEEEEKDHEEERVAERQVSF